KPEERWPSCRDFVEALAAVPEQPVPRISGGKGARAGAAAPTTVSQWPSPSSRPGPLWVSSLGMLALAPVILLLAVHPNASAEQTAATEEQAVVPAAAQVPANFVNSVGMKMVLVPGGSFTMGALPRKDDVRDDDGPPHTVRLTQPYYLS